MAAAKARRWVAQHREGRPGQGECVYENLALLRAAVVLDLLEELVDSQRWGSAVLSG